MYSNRVEHSLPSPESSLDVVYIYIYLLRHHVLHDKHLFVSSREYWILVTTARRR